MNNITKEMIFGGKKKIENTNNDTFKETTENKTDKIIQIDPNKMVDFQNGQPFSMYNDEKIQEMKESILRNGILNPILARKIDNDKYEIISGHNRVRCAKELDLKTVPVIIMDVDDDNAELIMIETNLNQRENILPCEKGKALKKQLEIIKKLQKSNFSHDEKNSANELAEKSNESTATIYRFIRLTELIEPLQDKVNRQEQISIKAGIHLSYISKEEQEIVNKVIDDNKLKVSGEQAESIKAIKGTITEENIVEIFAPKQKESFVRFTGKISKDTFKKYKEKFNNNAEFDELINKLLEEYFSEKEVNSEVN